MKLSVESRVAFPREQVYRTYRDRLVELLPYLPNVRAIVEQSRSEEPPITRVVNLWRGGGDIPKAVRAVLSEQMLSWTDHASWDASRWSCAWRMEAHSFPDAIHASGVNTFREVDGGTVFEMDGELSIDGRKLPVPRLLASTVGAAAERFLVGMIKPNLTEVTRGLARFLEAEGARG